jgi:hypothetical protein
MMSLSTYKDKYEFETDALRPSDNGRLSKEHKQAFSRYFDYAYFRPDLWSLSWSQAILSIIAALADSLQPL